MQPIKYRPGAVLALGQRSDRLIAAATTLGALALGVVAARNILSHATQALARVKQTPVVHDRLGAPSTEGIIVETMRVSLEIVEQRISRLPLR